MPCREPTLVSPQASTSDNVVVPITAVLFDLDETLFDHEGASAEAISQWLAARGAAVTPELLDAWFASERARFDEYLAGLVSFEQQRRNRMADISRAAELGLPRGLDSLDAMFYEFARLYEQDWRTFPDAVPAVDAVQDAGMGIGLLTNGQQAQQNAKVVHTGLDRLFPEVAISEAIGASKPSSLAFMRACELYDFDPSTTCMVGDNYLADVLGARDAGLHAIYVDRRDSGIEDPYRVNDLSHILDAIALHH